LDEFFALTAYPIGLYRLNLRTRFPGPGPFAIISDRFTRAELEEAVFPLDILMCLIAAPAFLLLSDGSANHYVTVESVDASGQILRILDGWPDQSFLIGSDLQESDRGRLINVSGGGTLIEVPARTVSTFWWAQFFWKNGVVF
jgi:hypothetical protein